MAVDYKSLGLKVGLEIHQHGSFSFPELNKIQLGQEKCESIFLWFSKERNAPGHLKKENVRSSIARDASYA